MNELDRLILELQTENRNGLEEWPIRNPDCPSITALLDIALNQAEAAVVAGVHQHLTQGCPFCRCYFQSLQRLAPAAHCAVVTRAWPESVRQAFREEWQPALAADAGAYDHVRTVCLRSAKAEIHGWIEWYRPTKGYWQARLRFPSQTNKLISADNDPFLNNFIGLMVKIAVTQPGKKVTTMRSQLRLDQDDLTSTWMPVRLEQEPKEYAFAIIEVDPPANA